MSIILSSNMSVPTHVTSLNQSPIITADSGYKTVSQRYQVVPTAPLAEKFKSMGFVVDSFSRRGCRSEEKRPFVKHQVRLSHPELLRNTVHRDIRLQLIITNSFDGSAAFRMGLGFFRLVCANGMMVGETYETFRHRHVGNIIEEVDESVERIVAQTNRLMEDLDKMKSKVLTSQQVIDFYNQAIKIKNPDIDSALFMPRRQEDTAKDLFTVLNVVQEGIIRGNTQAVLPTGERFTMRTMRNLSEIERVNRELFDLALQFANAS